VGSVVRRCRNRSIAGAADYGVRFRTPSSTDGRAIAAINAVYSNRDFYIAATYFLSYLLRAWRFTLEEPAQRTVIKIAFDRRVPDHLSAFPHDLEHHP
jgi:hypothetical protein